jgi:cell division protein ZapA
MPKAVEQALTINLKLADRTYPVKTSAANEELFRKAGKLINESLEGFKGKYPRYDRQDLFVMVAFYAMVEKLVADADKEKTEKEIALKISHINQLIDNFSA